jgi:hypothetical protein
MPGTALRFLEFNYSGAIYRERGTPALPVYDLQDPEASGRSDGFFFRQLSTRSASQSSTAGFFLRISSCFFEIMALMMEWGVFPVKGSSPVKQKYRRTPREKISHAPVIALLVACSGEIK